MKGTRFVGPGSRVCVCVCVKVMLVACGAIWYGLRVILVRKLYHQQVSVLRDLGMRQFHVDWCGYDRSVWICHLR